MKCQECIHNEMCYATHTDDSHACCNFKNAADVVEVVRCRDCREYTPVEGGKPLCALHSIGVAYDDFCSYAERRSE